MCLNGPLRCLLWFGGMNVLWELCTYCITLTDNLQYWNIVYLHPCITEWDQTSGSLQPTKTMWSLWNTNTFKILFALSGRLWTNTCSTAPLFHVPYWCPWHQPLVFCKDRSFTVFSPAGSHWTQSRHSSSLAVGQHRGEVIADSVALQIPEWKQNTESQTPCH